MTEPVRVLELRSVRGTGGGPEKTILLSAARADPSELRVTVCYLRDRRDEVFAIGERAMALGLDYVEVAERNSLDASIWPQLRRVVSSREIDIIHAHDYKTDLLALLLSHVEGCVPLATVHGWSGRSLRERAYYFFDRRVLEFYPLVVCVSDEQRQVLLARGFESFRLRVVHNGVDPEEFRRDPKAGLRLRERLSIHPEALVLGSVGRLEPEKRYDLLLQAVQLLGNDLGVHVVLAGEGSERSNLIAAARQLGLGDRLHLLGQVPDVRQVVSAFDVFIQSSDTEGLPNSLLEAMALEIPIVATRVGGTGELARDGIDAILVSRGNAEAIASAVRAILADTGSTRRRVGAARRRVEREFSFDGRLQTMGRVYEEVLRFRPWRLPAGRARVGAGSGAR